MDTNPNNEQAPIEPPATNPKFTGPEPTPAPIEPMQGVSMTPAYPTSTSVITVPATPPDYLLGATEPVATGTEPLQPSFSKTDTLAYPQPESPNPSYTPEKKKLTKLWIGLGIVLILIGGLIVAFFILKK
jgi:hypothetical protein